MKSKFDISHALEWAHRFHEHFSQTDCIDEFAVAGSARRRVAVVGDLDLIVVTDRPKRALKHFLAFPRIKEVLCAGQSKASVELVDGLQVDMRFVERQQFGAMLAHCTGPAEHNISLRTLARRQGLKVNEYGVWRGQECISSAAESTIYEALGLAWIAPESRGNLANAYRKQSHQTVNDYQKQSRRIVARGEQPIAFWSTQGS